MLRLTNLSNVYKRRTLRVLYGNTQAYPYAATLSSFFDRTAGGQLAVTNSKATINPGSVAVKLVGEIVTLAGSTEGANPTVETAAVRPFGLFANFVGGELDELGTAVEVGVWRGVGSVYEVLAPAFDAAGGVGMSVAAAAEAGSAATNDVTNLVAAADGRLVQDSLAVSPYVASHRAAARLISYLSANAIIVESLV